MEAYRAMAEKVEFISLYGQSEESVRIPAQALTSLTDIVVDIQDVGCRYFTYTTSLAYLVATLSGMASPPRLWVVDRANPAGRQVEGTPLPAVFSSFIGHAACRTVTACRWVNWHVGSSDSIRGRLS